MSKSMKYFLVVITILVCTPAFAQTPNYIKEASPAIKSILYKPGDLAVSVTPEYNGITVRLINKSQTAMKIGSMSCSHWQMWETDNPNLGLDVGNVGCFSNYPVEQWIQPGGLIEEKFKVVPSDALYTQNIPKSYYASSENKFRVGFKYSTMERFNLNVIETIWSDEIPLTAVTIALPTSFDGQTWKISENQKDNSRHKLVFTHQDDQAPHATVTYERFVTKDIPKGQHAYVAGESVQEFAKNLIDAQMKTCTNSQFKLLSSNNYYANFELQLQECADHSPNRREVHHYDVDGVVTKQSFDRMGLDFKTVLPLLDRWIESDGRIALMIKEELDKTQLKKRSPQLTDKQAAKAAEMLNEIPFETLHHIEYSIEEKDIVGDVNWSKLKQQWLSSRINWDWRHPQLHECVLIRQLTSADAC